jgi:holo-[acyl-carrier protein] synthase
MMGMQISLPAGGILIGLGCDLIEVDRIKGVWTRQGDRFLERVFTEEERVYCLGYKFPHKHLAARFAAKEAVSKCFTTGIGAELSWKSISIYHGARQEPLVRLDERGAALLKQVGGTHVLVSLSHTELAAMAVAAIVKAP